MTSEPAPAPVELPDPSLADAAKARLSTLERGAATLGSLAELVVWATKVRGSCPPAPFERIRCLAIAADQGIAEAPSLPTLQAVMDGAGPLAMLARSAAVEIRRLDVGLADGADAGASADDNHRIRPGSGAIDRENAMTEEEVLAAVALGRALVDEEVDAGTDLLIPAAIGVDASVPAVVVAAVLSGREPIWALGFDATMPDREWIRQCRIVRDALRRTTTLSRDPYQILATVGSIDLAVITGILIQAGVRRTPVLLDGTVAATAALLAIEVAPAAQSWWTAPQRSGASTERVALETLDLEPVVPLELRLGEGCGALAAVPLLRTAMQVLTEFGSTPPPAEPKPEPDEHTEQHAPMPVVDDDLRDDPADA
jgi:nicotinate-nucleotide--dimethylbenzimidazole phosphoribosyltransferase